MSHLRLESLILYEDEHLIAVDKPPSLSSLDERSGAESRPAYPRRGDATADQRGAGKETARSLLRIVRERYPEARLCHRIDRETTGVVIVAKDASTYRTVSELFRTRRVEKIYEAVVFGRPQFHETAVEHHLITVQSRHRNPEGRKIATFRAIVDRRRGKRSTTVVTTMEMGRHLSLLECRPKTGRLHQIRAHLAREGFPILSDLLYGGKMIRLSEIKRGYHRGGDDPEPPLIARVALHARSVAFPYEGGEFRIEAPLPKDLNSVLKLLRKYDGLAPVPIQDVPRADASD